VNTGKAGTYGIILGYESRVLVFCWRCVVRYFESISSERLIEAPPRQEYRVWQSERLWMSVQPSDTIFGIGFTGRHKEYTSAALGIELGV
jgi:hypothetical protein